MDLLTLVRALVLSVLPARDLVNLSRMNGCVRLSIKNITAGPDPAKYTESTEDSGPGLRNLSENDDHVAPGPVQIGKQLL